MPNSLLFDIGIFLKTNNLIVDDGVDFFRDFKPENPDSVVAIIEYRGDPREYYEPHVINRSLQISVRDKNADIARSKALSIYNLLYSENTVVHFTEERWGQVYLRQPPMRIEEDSTNRVTYGFNIGVTTTIY